MRYRRVGHIAACRLLIKTYCHLRAEWLNIYFRPFIRTSDSGK